MPPRAKRLSLVSNPRVSFRFRFVRSQRNWTFSVCCVNRFNSLLLGAIRGARKGQNRRTHANNSCISNCFKSCPDLPIRTTISQNLKKEKKNSLAHVKGFRPNFQRNERTVQQSVSESVAHQGANWRVSEWVLVEGTVAYERKFPLSPSSLFPISPKNERCRPSTAGKSPVTIAVRKKKNRKRERTERPSPPFFGRLESQASIYSHPDVRRNQSTLHSPTRTRIRRFRCMCLCVFSRIISTERSVYGRVYFTRARARLCMCIFPPFGISVRVRSSLGATLRGIIGFAVKKRSSRKLRSTHAVKNQLAKIVRFEFASRQDQTLSLSLSRSHSLRRTNRDNKGEQGENHWELVSSDRAAARFAILYSIRWWLIDAHDRCWSSFTNEI